MTLRIVAGLTFVAFMLGLAWWLMRSARSDLPAQGAEGPRGGGSDDLSHLNLDSPNE